VESAGSARRRGAQRSSRQQIGQRKDGPSGFDKLVVIIELSHHPSSLCGAIAFTPFSTLLQRSPFAGMQQQNQ